MTNIEPVIGHRIHPYGAYEKFVFDIKEHKPYGDRLRFSPYKAASKRRAELFGHPMRL